MTVSRGAKDFFFLYMCSDSTDQHPTTSPFKEKELGSEAKHSLQDEVT